MAIKTLLWKGWEHASSIIFFAGFLIDSFLLPAIEREETKYLGMTWLTLLALSLILREWVVSRNTATKIEQKLYSLLTFGISFFSGSALSFVFVYAMRSAALSVSWPLFIILLIAMFANEFVATHGYRFTLDVGIFFVALVFYDIFNVPILFGKVNDFVFFVSILLSATIAFVYSWILKHFSEAAETEMPRGYALAIGIPLFVAMLYFLNIIPAVPLSLKSSGIYHSVEKVDANGDYIGLGEIDHRFLARYRTQVYHLTDSDTGIYFFSSVGAPAEISAPVTHVWEQYDESTKKWVTSTTVAFDIIGGRDTGFRAYSKKENITPGLWRVTVKVDGNRIVGRQEFYIEKGKNAAVEEVKL